MFGSMTAPTCKHTKDSQTKSKCAEEKSEECVETVQTQKRVPACRRRTGPVTCFSESVRRRLGFLSGEDNSKNFFRHPGMLPQLAAASSAGPRVLSEARSGGEDRHRGLRPQPEELSS